MALPRTNLEQVLELFLRLRTQKFRGRLVVDLIEGGVVTIKQERRKDLDVWGQVKMEDEPP